MITKHDIKPGFRFSTAKDDYIVIKIKSNNMVHLQNLNTDTSHTFDWIYIDQAVDIFKTNIYFKPYKQLKLTYIEEL